MYLRHKISATETILILLIVGTMWNREIQSVSSLENDYHHGTFFAAISFDKTARELFRRPPSFLYLKLLNSALTKTLARRRLFKFAPVAVKANPTCRSYGGTTCYSPLAYGLCVVKMAAGVIDYMEANEYCSQYGNGHGEVHKGPVPQFDGGDSLVMNVPWSPSQSVRSYMQCLGVNFNETANQAILVGLASKSDSPQCTYILVKAGGTYLYTTTPCIKKGNSNNFKILAPACVVAIRK